jgi:hypothetical protein
MIDFAEDKRELEKKNYNNFGVGDNENSIQDSRCAIDGPELLIVAI